MKMPEIEIDNQMLVSTIKSITKDLNPDEVIKIEIDAVGRENSKDIIIKIRTEPKSEEGLFQQHFETGQKLKNVHKESNKRLVCLELPKGPRATLIEFKKDGPYFNGARIDGVTDMNIESKVGGLTNVDVKLVAKVHGLDDIDKGYSFLGDRIAEIAAPIKHEGDKRSRREQRRKGIL